MSELISVNAMYMRGGTSKGVFLSESDLPADRSLWGPYLVEIFGGRSFRQITGMGGADITTSKACIIGQSSHPDYDIVYTFAQVGIGDGTVQWDTNCGNLSAAVGVFAVLAGFVRPTEPETRVRVWQANTRSPMCIRVPVGPEGPCIDGALEIGGVPGSGAAISVDFAGTVGASLGRGLFPTGNRTDTIDVSGVGQLTVSIVDLANMCVFFDPRQFGLTGTESPTEGRRIEPVWSKVRAAAQAYLGIPATQSTPWPVSVVDPVDYLLSDGTPQRADAANIVARIVDPPEKLMHQALPGTGASCVAAAMSLQGTLVHRLASGHHPTGDGARTVVIGHPSGVIRVGVDVDDSDGLPIVREVTTQRTVNPIMEGRVFLRTRELEDIVSTTPTTALTRSGVPSGSPE